MRRGDEPRTAQRLPQFSGHPQGRVITFAYYPPVIDTFSLGIPFMALTITNISKVYPNGVRALKNLSLTIGNNMFGLLGPNGAGKSSLMRTIATLQDPDSGSIDLDGVNVLTQKDSVRKILGYLPQEFGVYPRMSAVDMLNHLAILKGVIAAGERKEMVDALLHQTNLWDVRKKALSTYSGGMKQRFGIAQALLANPRLIIVDEPTAGLDPAERNRFLNLLSSIGRDVVVILSTHIVDDVRELCPRMAIIASGEVLLEGSPTEALAALDGQIWSKVVATDEELRAIEAELQVISTHLVGGQHEIRVFAAASPGSGFQAVPSGLEDVYFLNLSRHAVN
jgi:ABC-2 type transport system ATP-binding protein